MARSTGNRWPAVTGLVAALMIAGFVLPGSGPEGAALEMERTREAARAFYDRHPEVRLSPRDRALLGRQHVELAETGRVRGGSSPRLTPQLLARRQRQFDALADAAFGARVESSAAWRHGVGPGDPVNRDFIAYGFFQDSVIAFAIALTFFLIAGVGIEGAWGSWVFAVFCLGAFFFPALAHASLAPEGGVPLAGASGLLGAVGVAYWLRGAGGRFVLPGWLLFLIWLFAEYVIVRRVWPDGGEGLPLWAHGAGFAVGGLAALAMGWLGGERRLASRSEGSAGAGHPALAIAARAEADEHFEAAWSVLANAWADAPDDDDVALALWKFACDQGRAGEVVGAVVPRIRDAVRQGRLDAAMEHYFEIIRHAPEAQLEAQLTTRLAEALIERGDTVGAREALRRAVEDPEGLPTALAQRVARSAREIEPDIAQRAAAMALEDAQLDPDSRDALEALVSGGGSVPVRAAEEVAPAEPDQSEGILELGEPLATAPQAEDEPAAPGLDEAEEVHLPEAEEDPEDEVVTELGLADDEELTPPDEIEFEPEPVSGTPLLADIDPATLSIGNPEDELSAAASGEDEEASDLAEAETWTPFPGLDLSPAEKVDLQGEAAGEESAEGDGLDLGTQSLEEEDEDPILEVGEELLIEEEPVPDAAPRSVKLIEGVPVELGEDALEVEIEGHGLGRIPYGRIEALAVAAVSGLSARPVLVIDLVLNWRSEPSEPFKLIRIQGNHFDPLVLSPDAPSPVQAMKDVITHLVERSGAECLPSDAAVAGDPFRRFAGLAEYEGEVLGVAV